MTAITTTVQVSEHNTKTVETSKGQKKVLSVMLTKGVYIGGVWLPDFIEFGDVIQVFGEVQKNDRDYLEFKFPSVQKVFIDKNFMKQDLGEVYNPFSEEETEKLEVLDEELPF